MKTPLFALLAAAFAAGCATPPPEPPPAPPPPAGVAVALDASLSAKAVGTAETEGASALVAAALAAAREELSARGCWLDAEPADVVVSLSAADRVTDRTGRNVVMEADVSLAAEVPARGGAKLASGAFRIQSPQVLGEEAARQDLAKNAVPRVRRWVAEKAAPANVGLAAADVAFSAGTLAEGDEWRAFGWLADALRKADGVAYVRETSRDAANRSARLRVVYAPGRFPPGGFLPSVLAAHPELPVVLGR